MLKKKKNYGWGKNPYLSFNAYPKAVCLIYFIYQVALN